MKMRAADKRRSAFSGAIVLAVGSIIAKVLGAAYRVPLTNILGAEGMGRYQLVFPVYALLITIAAAGVPTVLCRITAESIAEGKGAKRYLYVCLAITLVLSLAFALLVWGLADKIAVWQGNAMTASGFRIVAPAIVVVGVIGSLRGWFQGQMYMTPTAVSNIIEQVVKLALGIGLSIAALPKGIQASVNASLFAMVASEVCAMVYLLITHLVRSKHTPKEQLRLQKGELGGLFKMALPIGAVAILLPLSSFFDSVIIVNALKMRGVLQAEATAQYGLFSGPVNSLTNLPIVLIMSLAVAILPSVSASRVQHDISQIMLKSRLSVRLSYIIGVPFAFFFAVFAKNILSLIYPSLDSAELHTATNLLRIVSFNVVLMSASQIYISLLQALDKSKMAVLSLVFAIIVKVGLNFLCIAKLGIWGAGISSLCMCAVLFLSVSVSYYWICGMHLEKNVALNLVCGVIMVLSALGATYFVRSNIAILIVAFLVACVVYLFATLLTGVIQKEDIPHLPMRKVIARLHRAIRFWEYDGKNENAN